MITAEASLDVLLREACWDLPTARRVVAEVPEITCQAPPRFCLWNALAALVESDPEGLDPAMVMHRVTSDRLPGWDDTARWMADLTTGGFAAGTVGWHLNAVKEHAARLGLMQLADRARQAAEGDVDEAVTLVRTGLDRIATRTVEAPPTVADLLMPHLERLETKDTTRRVGTGMPDLDERLAGGFRPGQLVVVGAATGAGKSLLLGGFARHAALREQVPVLFHSLEMGRDELMDRLLAAEARVNLQSLNARDLNEDDWSRLSRRLDAINTGQLFIDDNPTRTVADIAATAKPLRPALLCVDYVQLLTPTGKSNNRQEEVANLSRALKLLARDLRCTVIAAAQLNRAADQRSDKTPRLSDLRESGAIANDADVVLLLDRDENDDTLGSDASLIIAKQRGGPLGSVPLVFTGHHARFDSAWRP